MKLVASILLLSLASCATDDPVDPDPVFQDLCNNFLPCPDPAYESVEDCKSMHQSDYDLRSPTCQKLVLEFEECLAALTCAELEIDGALPDAPCRPEEDRLSDAGCDSL